MLTQQVLITGVMQDPCLFLWNSRDESDILPLVSCDGIMPIEATVDYVGPMSKTVEDCALLLEVLVREDQDSGSIPRAFKEDGYLSQLKMDVII